MRRTRARWLVAVLVAATSWVLPPAGVARAGTPARAPAGGGQAPAGMPTAAPADGGQAPAGMPAASAPAPAPDLGSTLRIGLNDAVRMAIQNNLDVQLLRFDPLEAVDTFHAAWGAYDPQIFGQGGTQYAETPVASSILPNQNSYYQRSWSGDAGLEGLIPWLGGSYSISYGSAQVNTDQVISVLSPAFQSQFAASLSVPLLRNLFWSPTWTLVRTTRIGVDASRQQFESQLMDVVRSTEDAYWGLTAARDGRRVAAKSLETARALLDQTKAQYQVGVVSKVDVVQAEAGVADREFRLITADAVERNAQDALIDAVLGPWLAPDSKPTVELTDLPEDVHVQAVDPKLATEKAFEYRPELALARSQIATNEVELRFASNQRLPRLDVTGTYGYQGLSGRVSRNCVNFGGGACTATVPHDWSSADDKFFTKDGDKNYGIEGVLSIPIGNVTARSNYDKAQLELRRSRTQLKRLEQSIVSDIRKAARNLQASLEGIQAAERGVVAATEQLRAERVRLEYGESTPFDVLLKEEALVQAENQLILAQQVYHNSVTALDRAQGTILSANGIVVEQAAALR
jgi:outer membrane protein